MWMNSVLSSNRGSPARFSRVGIDGPKISVSKMPVRIPRRANERARFTEIKDQLNRMLMLIATSINWLTTPAIVDLPTPPFAEETATTFFTSLIFRFSGNPRRRGNDGGVPERGSPYNTTPSAEVHQAKPQKTYQGILMLKTM